MTTDRRYCAFICYSQQDRAQAERLHRRLESFPVPRHLAGTPGAHGEVPATLRPVFRDRDELAASADIGERLRDALARSDFLVVLCSPAAAQSSWVNAEIEAFCGQTPGGRGRVLAVIVAGEPVSGDPATECFPSALLDASPSAAGLKARYPLAADFRPGRDRRANAELRLIAALLGVEFEHLRQREQERRVSRLRFGLAVAALLSAGFAALATFAIAQREEARAAAERAHTASIRAESVRREAEKLVEFMLKELRPKLEIVGRLDLLEPANEKVRDYYRTVTREEEDLEVLRRQGHAFHAYAVDLRSHKRGSKTLTILETAAVLRLRVAELSPTDVAAWQDLAETHRFMALQRRDDGDIDGALREIAAARRYAQKGLDLQPDNLKSAARVASLPNDEGEMLIRAGRTAEAKPLLEISLGQLERLIARDPTNLEILNRAAAAAWQLGNVHRRMGDFTAAEAAYLKGLKMAEGLCAREPENIFYLRRRELASGTLGQMFLESGRFAEAVERLSDTLVFSSEVVAVDPGSLVYQEAMATNLSNLAEAELNIGRFDEAQSHISECVKLREKALAAGATDVRSRHSLALALATRSGIDSKLGRHGAAIETAKRGVGFMEELTAANPTDVRVADDEAFLRSKLAQALLAGGRSDDALEAYLVAIARLDGVIGREPNNPQLTRWRDRASWQLGLGEALQAAGRPAEARAALTECMAIFKRVGQGGLPDATYAEDMKQAAALLALVTLSP